MPSRVPGNHRKLILPVFTLALSAATSAAAALRYDCRELQNMAERFQTFKQQGYALEDVIGVVQEAAAGTPEKDALLSNLAIEIFVDPDIRSAAQARRLAAARCTTAR